MTLRFAIVGCEEARAPWSQLAAVAEGSALAGPEMVLAAAGRVAPTGWRLALVDDGTGRLRAAAPFRLSRSAPVVGPRIAEVFWSGNGPAAGLLADGADEAAIGALLDGLAAEAGVLRLGFALTDTPAVRALESVAAARGLKVFRFNGHQRAALRRGEAGLGPLFTGSGLKELRRLHRRLGETGALVHQVAATAEDVTAALPDFLDLEAAGWKGRGGTALASSAGTRSFAETLVQDYAAAGGARLDLLRLDGRIVAGLVTLRRGDHAAIWKIAYDETLARFSPGAQVLRLATEAFMADPSLALVDSLATPGHPLADRAWAGRLPVANMLVATSERTARAASLAFATERGMAAFRRAVSEVRRRTARTR